MQSAGLRTAEHKPLRRQIDAAVLIQELKSEVQLYLMALLELSTRHVLQITAQRSQLLLYRHSSEQNRFYLFVLSTDNN